MMLRRTNVFRSVLIVGLCLGLNVSAGEPEAKKTTKTASRTKTPAPRPVSPINDVAESLNAGRTPAAATIERIMDQAVRNIAARYNLNDVQTEITADMMRRGVYKFLRENEDEVWPVLRDLLKWRLRAPDDPEARRRIGKTARPLLEKAKAAILEANEQWRAILNEEQRRVHDFDLREMETTFRKIDERFSEWETGKKPHDEYLFPEPNLAGEPARPTRPKEGTLPVPQKEMFNPKHIFEAMVERFIKDYDLKEGQITAARSILEEYKIKADDFCTANKAAFAEVIAKQQDALRRRDMKAVKEAAAEHKKLLKPIYAMGEQMQTRLRGLLETAQIERYEARKKGTRPVRKKPAEKKSAGASNVGTSGETSSSAGS
ncbi:MAG: hypothetical protein D6788_00625 [Planctomycetota bacterium]|nr:MAG: hypothetical protein D6788_00625 [Planctomycetota bacterium]